jgi:hypothetical protein
MGNLPARLGRPGGRCASHAVRQPRQLLEVADLLRQGAGQLGALPAQFLGAHVPALLVQLLPAQE